MDITTSVVGASPPTVINPPITSPVSIPAPIPLQPAVTSTGNFVSLPVPGAVVAAPQPPVASKPALPVQCMPSPGAATSLGQPAGPMLPRPIAAPVDKVLDKRRLQELVKEVDPLEQLDEDVEELLLQIADDFIDNVATAACLVAKHRKANTVEVKDVQLHLEQNWNMLIPGFGSEELRPYKKAATTEAHKQRMALIKKTLKKY